MTTSDSDPTQSITSIAQLETLYGLPVQRSLLKEIDYLSEHYQAFVRQSPFVLVASSGPQGLDCSPRGDQPGFVRVVDERTLLLPDRRGNNRVDTLRNLVLEPRISLLFLIPGIGETLRVNGNACLLIDPTLCESFSINGKVPKCVIRVSIERAYFQCQKALVRSKLWHPESSVSRAALPSAGDMLAALSAEPFDGESYDKAYPRHLQETLY